ncbi:DUF2267 domain-containing protein [Actinomycetospora lutea]|uniref:DUF2267 domain-containing protein n=1 Tax=Actinomycetospora lutea TaxID=663604 RepID=UPI0030822B84
MSHDTDRVTRARLHALRDRLTVDAAGRSGAQLPEVRRGLPPTSATAGHPDRARTAP